MTDRGGPPLSRKTARRLRRSVWSTLLAGMVIAGCSGGSDVDASDSALSDQLQETSDSDRVPGEGIPSADDSVDGGAGQENESTDGPDDGSAGGTSTTLPGNNNVFLNVELDKDQAVYTALNVADPAVLGRPALAVKIDNVEAARPQAGIIEADVVWEEMVEGGLTRFLAVYHSTDPSVVGPVRSARMTDIPLLMPLANPLFSWSGSNAAFADLLRTTAIVDVGVDAEPGLYVRNGDRQAPSNLYASPVDLRALTPSTAQSPRPMFSFALNGEPLGDGAHTVSGVDVDFGSTEVTFRWTATKAGWERTQNGTPHLDDQGEVVSPQNVVVQFVPYILTDVRDSNGARVPQADIVQGQGEAWMLSGGQVIEGTWYKDNVTVASVFLDRNGERVLTAPGRTWILLVPAGQASLVP
jgi:hypothetical protein